MIAASFLRSVDLCIPKVGYTIGRMVTPSCNVENAVETYLCKLPLFLYFRSLYICGCRLPRFQLERKKKEGTYKTKKQKEQEARAEAAKAAMLAAGLEGK